MKSSKYGLGLAIAACMAFGAAPASAATEKVLAGDINSASSGWHSADTRTGSTAGTFGTATFRTGPAIAPLGGGSVQLRTDNGAAKVQLLTDRFNGTRLDQIDGIGYSTYRALTSTGSANQVPALNLRVDTDNNGTPDAYMVYEPVYNPTPIVSGSWQDWDAYRGGTAVWFFNNGAGGCSTAADSRCTLNDIVTRFPNATIREPAAGTPCGTSAAPITPCAGSLGFNQGSGNPGILANADALYVSKAGDQTTFDFEAEAGPTGPAGSAGATGPQGQSGGQGQQGLTPSSITTTGKVSLVSKSLKVAKKTRKVSVSVSCPRANGLCEGRLNLISRGKTIARTAFVVRGGRSGKVTLTLSKKGYKALKKSQKVKVDVFSRDLAGAASSARKTLTLKK